MAEKNIIVDRGIPRTPSSQGGGGYRPGIGVGGHAGGSSTHPSRGNISTQQAIGDLARELDPVFKARDAQYKEQFERCREHVEARLAEHARKAAAQSRTPAEAVSTERRFAIEWMESIFQGYARKTPQAHAFEGSNLFFVKEHLARRAIKQAILHPHRVSEVPKVLARLDEAYAAALELKYLSLAAHFLGNRLPDLSTEADRLETLQEQHGPDWAQVLANRARMIERERDVQLQRLPSFLQSRYSAALSDIDKLPLENSLKRLAKVLKQLAEAEQRQVQGFYTANPAIRSPLSRPELVALKGLVKRQARKELGPKWDDYHRHLYHAESARLLLQASKDMERLAERASWVAVGQAGIAAAARRDAQAKADQAKAEREQRENALAARLSKAVALPSGLAASGPLAFAATGALVTLENAGLTLQAAVRAGVSAVASAASGVLLGVTALVYSPKLGNGELPPGFGLAVPLMDVDPQLASRLADITAQPLQSAELSIRLTTASTLSGETIVAAVKTGGAIPADVKVVGAAAGQVAGRYWVEVPEVPGKTLLWTPAVSPPNASTTYPPETPADPYPSGPMVEPVTGRLDTFPSDTFAGLNDLIVWFPANSGLAPLYIVFADRRKEPGVATGQGQDVSGNWLAAASTVGAPIPSQIAAQLAGREFATFDKFREAFWRAVAGDSILLQFFGEDNRVELSMGRAPFAREKDTVGKRLKLELHHAQPIQHGGDVYGIDNIVVMTPRNHIRLHGQKGVDE